MRCTGGTSASGLLQSFREELEGLIQEQMKKGNNSSNIWALRQIADFMASTSHAVFPTSSMSMWGAGELPGAEVGEEGWGRMEGAVRSSLVARLRSEWCSCISRPGGVEQQPEVPGSASVRLQFKDPGENSL